MASAAYAKGLEQAFAGSLDWDADTINVMAVKTGYSLDQEAHDFYDDVSASKYVGTTDQALGSKTNTIDTGNNRVEIGGGAVTFSSVALNGSDDVIAFIVYMSTGTPGTSPLVAYDDTADITPNGGNITYTPNSEGILQLGY